MPELLPFFRTIEPQMIGWLTDLINTDTPSDDKPALDRLAPAWDISSETVAPRSSWWKTTKPAIICWLAGLHRNLVRNRS